MNAFLQRLFLVMVLGVFSACRKDTAQTITEMVTPELTVDRFGRTAEPGPIREAVSLQEISFMVRMREASSEILGQVQRRGLAEPIDDQAAATLTSQGASAPFLAQLKASPHVLTPPERQLHAKRAGKLKKTSEKARREEDAAIASSRAALNDRIRAAEQQRIGDRLKSDQARVSELETKLRKERYSRSSVSPYQGVARDLELARERANATSAELNRVR